MAYQVFFDAIEAQGRSLLRIPLVRIPSPFHSYHSFTYATYYLTQDLDDPSVSPPLAILDHAQILREIMLVYESTIDSSSAPLPTSGSAGHPEAPTHPAPLRTILDKLLDPAIDMVLSASEEKKRARVGWDAGVFVLNSLGYLQSVLEPFERMEEAREKMGVIRGVVENRVEGITEEHVSCPSFDIVSRIDI